MASNDVNLGLGRSTGMFYHAEAGTALPTSPGETLAADWTDIGDVSEDGITWTPFGSIDVIRNWALDAVRKFAGEKGKVSAAIIETTEESLKAAFGENAVTVTPATAAHGKLVSVDATVGKLGGPEAWLFIGKDGDDMFMLGTTSGLVTEIADIAFAPSGSINWEVTIEGDWTFIKDDGQTTP